MKLTALIDRIKSHPDYPKAGMILCHNGVVRGTSRDGRPVSGLTVTIDRKALDVILAEQRQRPGIIDILVEFREGLLKVGDDVMFIVVAGDLRDHVIPVLEDTLNAIKNELSTKKSTFYKQMLIYTAVLSTIYQALRCSLTRKETHAYIHTS